MTDQTYTDRANVLRDARTHDPVTDSGESQGAVRTFHAHDGLSFTRTDDGSVLVRLDDEEVLLSPETWASAVASMSAAGEDGVTFREALDRQAPEGD